jgi:hypothetical protein
MDTVNPAVENKIYFLSNDNEEMLTASQENRKIKRTYPRIRRCWTEFCRKIDDDKKKDKKSKEEPYGKQAYMLYSCSSTCFELFIQEV